MIRILANLHAVQVRWPLAAVVVLSLLEAPSVLAAAALAPATQPAATQPTARLTPMLGVDQVRVGMKGYGLSVFHGDKIEPFEVEVVSVMRDFGPQKSVIWIRCPDPRMQKSGPVAGMSGSPIYLWDDQEPQTLGQGGKLIGAFAFGFAGTKDCYVGVQPIKGMRDVGQRATAASPDALPSATTQAGVASATLNSDESSSTGGALMLSRLLAAAGETGSGLTPQNTWRAKALLQVISPPTSNQPRESVQPTAAIAAPLQLQGQPLALPLPMAVGSPALARLLAPALEPLGIAPVSTTQGLTAGSPPPGVDPQQVRIQPGSVLSIPLAFGDMDLSAIGTVTDVLPDGRVLAFGHAMFGQGRVVLPMASGYVHLVMPHLLTSFKVGGSAVIRGAILRDESSAIAGVPGAGFASSPVRVAVNMPGQPLRQYRYQIAQHRQLTPVIAGVTASQSLLADTNLPMENTMRLRGRLTFAGDRALDIDTLVPEGSPGALMMELVAPITVMAQNPHASMMLQSAQLSIDVEPRVRMATLVSGRLDRAELAPGQNVAGTVRLQPYGQPYREERFELDVPEDLPDGQYNLTLVDAAGYAAMLLANRPYLVSTASADDLYAVVQQITGIKSDAFYVVLQLPQQGLAVGRQELPRLPSSRRAMIAAPNTSQATQFGEWAERIVPLDVVPTGQVSFTINVRHDAGDRK